MCIYAHSHSFRVFCYIYMCMYTLKAVHNWIWKAFFPGGSHTAYSQSQSGMSTTALESGIIERCSGGKLSKM